MSDPLFQAIQQGDKPAVESWVATHTDWSAARASNGSTPIQTAMYYGEPELAQWLADRVPELEMADACVMGRVDAVHQALAGDPGAANGLTDDGFLPLCLAAAFGHPAVLVTLLDAGASPTLRSRSLGGVAPLDSAVFGRCLECVEILLAAGADPNAVQEGGFAPAHGAAQNGDVEMLRTLAAHGANLHVSNAEGKTPADLARDNGHEAALAFLTQEG